MNYKNAITMTTLSVIAVFAIASFAGFEIADTDAAPAAVQPAKYVFVEGTTISAEFTFRDGTELSPFQLFTQTGGFGTTTLEATSSTSGSSVGAQDDGGERTSRAKPSFTLEKNVGGTPYLYQAADEAQKYQFSSGFEYQYKFFDVDVFLTAGGDTLRAFEYKNCKVTSYAVTTRSDNEEGYTGKGIVYVDQYTFECDGYKPLNPAMDKMHTTEHAKTISSSDLKSTDKWEPGFSQK
ncbi:MAG: hypothetical protein K8Q88_03085 [Nitrosarchaeum sp.]|nr:hypothetical protein [Nitrosarchaeum sp.]